MIALALTLVVGACAIVVASLSSTTCLTIRDYAELSSENYHDANTFDARQDFYMTALIYENGEAALDAQYSEASHEELSLIAQFYKKHAQKPMVFTLAGEYTSSTQEALTQQRLDLLRAQLIALGIADADITPRLSTPSTSNDPERSDDNNIITLRLTSAAACN
jgi:hypothetical protein